MFDVLIKNGVIVDGSGKLMFRSDVGIKEEKIAKIGNLQNEKARLEIDAANKLVCPGFVDVNNHSDTCWQMFLDPDLESLAYQGVTTIIGGNCGSSLAPLTGRDSIQSIQKWINLGRISFSWMKMEEFFGFIENKELSVNFGTLVGHATLRRGIIQDETRGLDSRERQMMEIVLADSMKKGALGISAGLAYTHAQTATNEEMVALAKVVKKNNGIFVVHMRDERAGLLESIREVLKIAEESGVRMHISHLKAMGEKNWPLLGKALAILEESQKNGLDITFDVYPYISTGTVLYTLLPTWVSEGGKNKMLSRLKDSALRPKIIKDLKKEGFDYSKIKIAVSPIAKSLAKRNISEIAASQEKTIEDTLLDILIASNGQVVVTMEALSEENLEKTIINPLSIISSNGSGYNLAHAKTGEVVHPRSFGSFPRVLRKYVLEKKIISWEEAIRKMTSFPAERFGIAKRGRIQEEYFADVLIIDPEEIRDFATVENPYQYSRGVETVLVNGKPILQKENHLGARSGVVLKRTGHFQKLLSFLNR